MKRAVRPRGGAPTGVREAALAETEIRSPFAGLVTRRDRQAGDVVVPGTPIFQVVAVDEMWASVGVDEARMAADREVIQATLLRTRFNIARAAQELSVSRMTLYRRLRKLGITR